MASSFEILVQREETQDSDEIRLRLDLAAMTEADVILDDLLKPYGRNSFEFIDYLNESFRKANLWPWAIVAFEREYRLGGHVSATRFSRWDVAFSSYSILKDYSVKRNGAPPMSLLFFRNKNVASMLAPKSPLFSSCWSVLADKPRDKKWLCIPDPLPESWVEKTEKGDNVLFSMIRSGFQGSSTGKWNQ